MLTVLHTIASLHPDSGGPARTVTSLCDGLANQTNMRVALLTQCRGSEEVYHGALASDKLLLAKSDSRLVLRSGLTFRQELRSAVGNLKPDILHDHGVWLPTNHISASLALKSGIPYVVHTRGMLEPWALSFRAYKKKLAWNIYQRRNLQSAAAFFATSHAEADNIRELGFTQPIAIIPNGVDAPAKESRSRKELPQGRERRVVFMSRIHPKKGLLELMKAWSVSPTVDWKLVIAGPDEGGHLQEVRSSAERLGINGQVVYVGAVEGSDKAQLLASADLFVLPSFSENFGVVVAEALSHGVPVIATQGTPWQGLADHECGWWVKAEAAALSNALHQGMALSDKERFEMGARGQKYARHFDWSHIASDTAHVYRWLLGQADAPGCVRLN